MSTTGVQLTRGYALLVSSHLPARTVDVFKVKCAQVPGSFYRLSRTSDDSRSAFIFQYTLSTWKSAVTRNPKLELLLPASTFSLFQRTDLSYFENALTHL